MNASRLNVIGVIVLLVGLSAALLLSQNRPAPSQTTGDWKDSTLTLTDSKTNTRNIEMYGGQLEVLMVKWQAWIQRSESQALLIAITSALVALGCFLVARWQTTGRGAP
jgi:hypothetical protein